MNQESHPSVADTSTIVDMPRTTTAAPFDIRLIEVEARFPGGATVEMREIDTVEYRTEAATLCGDSQWNTLLVAVNCAADDAGIVLLPEAITDLNDSITDVPMNIEFDRIAYIDNAIATLERAKAILAIQQATA